jgi:type II secretory pathway pseudopilin PulG
MERKSAKGLPVSSSAAGFSVVEALIAALILLIIALGIIPLFARALRDNTAGADATQASNHGRARLEEYQQLPFNNQALTLAPGSTTLGSGESWAQGTRDTFGDDDEGWWPGAPSDRGLLLWTRTTTVRQFGINDLDDGRLDDPLPGGTQPAFVHLKEVEVRLESERPTRSPLGPGRQVVFRVLKPF